MGKYRQFRIIAQTWKVEKLLAREQIRWSLGAIWRLFKGKLSFFEFFFDIFKKTILLIRWIIILQRLNEWQFKSDA